MVLLYCCIMCQAHSMECELQLKRTLICDFAALKATFVSINTMKNSMHTVMSYALCHPVHSLVSLNSLQRRLNTVVVIVVATVVHENTPFRNHISHWENIVSIDMWQSGNIKMPWKTHTIMRPFMYDFSTVILWRLFEWNQHIWHNKSFDFYFVSFLLWLNVPWIERRKRWIKLFLTYSFPGIQPKIVEISQFMLRFISFTAHLKHYEIPRRMILNVRVHLSGSSVRMGTVNVYYHGCQKVTNPLYNAQLSG